MIIEINIDGHYFYPEIIEKWRGGNGELIFYRDKNKEHDENYFVFEREIISGEWGGSSGNTTIQLYIERELELYLPLYRKALENYKKLIILL